MGLLDLIYPRTCVGCGRWYGYICSNCINKISPFRNTFCPECEKGSVAGVTHVGCRKAYGLDGVTVFGKYEGLLKQYIHLIKYGFVSDATETLVEIIISLSDFSFLLSKKWLIMPVPLHKSRHRWRGFNQSALLARELAIYTDSYFSQSVLIKVKNTKPQMKLDADNRAGNIKGAFRLARKATLEGAQILLVDDVWTTGSTLREAVKPLKRAGAKSVWGFLVAS